MVPREALVLSILKGDTSVAEVAGQYALMVGEIEQWLDRFLPRAENALRGRP
jgi:hypothetical protein